MIYPRLWLARNLLAQDGVIFISIDDNEAHNLRKCCDDVFGAGNFVACLVWEKKKKGSFLSKSITNIKEYVLVYCRNNSRFEGLIGEINENTETYPCVNAVNKRELRTIPAGIESNYKEPNFFMPKGSEISDTTMTLVLHSDLVIKNGVLAEPLVIEGNWRYSQSAMKEYAKNKEIYITRDLYLRRRVNDARYKTMKDLLLRTGNDSELSHKDNIDINNLNASGWGSNEDADEELRLLLGAQKIIEYPKPSRLLIKLLASYRNAKDALVLDFFSGSATTAHAVLQLNAEDGGNRRFIMIQLPEECAEGSEARKAGFANICEIGEERIRRAGRKIREENAGKADGLDTGFRVFKVDSSNMKDVYYTPEETAQEGLGSLVDNIKEDREPEDLLFQAMLELGIELSADIVEEEIAGHRVFFVRDGALAACFDANIKEETLKEIAKRQPLFAVLRDSGLSDDSAFVNFEQIFKAYSSNTRRRVL